MRRQSSSIACRLSPTPLAAVEVVQDCGPPEGGRHVQKRESYARGGGRSGATGRSICVDVYGRGGRSVRLTVIESEDRSGATSARNDNDADAASVVLLRRRHRLCGGVPCLCIGHHAPGP